MTCYPRLDEVGVVVRAGAAGTDSERVASLWPAASGVDGRDAARDAMPVDHGAEALLATGDAGSASFLDVLLPWVTDTLIPQGAKP